MSEFEILFKDNWFKKNNVVMTVDKKLIRVISRPRRRWYHILLQWITFGWFTAKWTYTVELLNKGGTDEKN